MAQAIASLGSNIKHSQFIMRDDFTGLRGAIRNELTRRNKPNPGDTYTYNPAIGAFIRQEHISKVITDCLAIGNSNSFNLSGVKVVTSRDIDNVISYIQMLQNQVCIL